MESVNTLGLTAEEQKTLEEARAAQADRERDQQVAAACFDSIFYRTRLDRARRAMANAEQAVTVQINSEPGRSEEAKTEQLRPALARLEDAAAELKAAEEAEKASPDTSKRLDELKKTADERRKAEDDLVKQGQDRLARIKSGTVPPPVPTPKPTPAPTK